MDSFPAGYTPVAKCYNVPETKGDDKVKHRAFGWAIGWYIEQAKEDSVEWLAGSIPPGFDFNYEWERHPLAFWTLNRQKPNVLKWLLKRGAVVTSDMVIWANNNPRATVSKIIIDTPTERKLCTVVACSLNSLEGPFTGFLCKGVYDPRLLIHVVNFAFVEDVSHKRKF